MENSEWFHRRSLRVSAKLGRALCVADVLKRFLGVSRAFEGISGRLRRFMMVSGELRDIYRGFKRHIGKSMVISSISGVSGVLEDNSQWRVLGSFRGPQ